MEDVSISCDETKAQGGKINGYVCMYIYIYKCKMRSLGESRQRRFGFLCNRGAKKDYMKEK